MSLDLTRFVLEISPTHMAIILLLLSSRFEYIRLTNEELVITMISYELICGNLKYVYTLYNKTHAMHIYFLLQQVIFHNDFYRINTTNSQLTINQKSIAVVLVHYIGYEHNIHAEKYVTKQCCEKSQKNIRVSTQTIVSVSQRRDAIIQNLVIECRETAFVHRDGVYDVVITTEHAKVCSRFFPDFQ